MPRPSLKSSLVALTAAAVALSPMGLTANEALPHPSEDVLAVAMEGLDPTRVFPDPLINGDFLQFTSGTLGGLAMPYLEGLEELENRYSVNREDGAGAIEVNQICALVCDLMDDEDLHVIDMSGSLVRDENDDPVTITSYGGRDLPVITLTAPSTMDNPAEDRLDLYFSLSIHGAERAGVEGGLRYVEDLLIGFEAEQTGVEPVTGHKTLSAGDPTNPDYAEYSVTEVLESARIHFIAPNPDGWADGDRNDGRGLFQRGNDNGGLDLNRQFPTLGWHASGRQYNTASEPESRSVISLIEDYMGVPEGAADLHGEFADNVLLAIMFPAGQFDPLQLQGQYRLAEAIKFNVNTSVHPGAAGLLSEYIEGEVYPAEYHTAYDAIGYDDSGFQGDYLVQSGILEMDHEYIFSNLVPSSVFVPELEQVHVDTTRALLDATIAVTLKAYEDSDPARADRTLPGLDYEVNLDGDGDGAERVGYVFDPETIDHTDVENGPRYNLPQQPYSSTSMAYFSDMQQVLADGSVVEPIADLEEADLEAYDRIVVVDDTIAPEDTARWALLDSYTRGGGDLVLTDSALRGLEVMGAVAAGTVDRDLQYAGEISEVDTDHPLLEGVGGIIRQTYFEVPMGYRMGTAPAWFVDADAWTGTTAATVGGISASQDLILTSTYGNSTDDVTLIAGDPAVGTIDHGEGRITIFGAILPDAGNVGPNTHGLADYAVTYAGNGILLNALRGR